MIKLETHCHSAPASRCGRIGAEIIVPGLISRGYDAVALTNHYYNGDERSPDALLQAMIADYELMKRLGEEQGLRVFFGAELRFAGSKNDYLLYGMTPRELGAMGAVYDGGLQDFWREKPENVLIYQAHPFRDGMTRADVNFLDGIEVYNGHPEHEARNCRALEWARESEKSVISGSDSHFTRGLGRGGVYLPRMPEDERDLARLLRGVTEKELIRC